MKQTRDETFVKKEGKVSVMRTEAIASFGGAHLPVEEQYLIAKALRGWGVVHLDSEIAFGRRVFTEGVRATCGIDVPDGSWAAIAQADVVLTVGSDHAASQPLSTRWARRAQERGATWIVVDPVRTRTAEMADIHLPLRPGTDTAFFGGLIRYIIEQNRWQPEYVLNFTNASYLLSPTFSYDGGSGLFFGWNPVDGAYDKEPWSYQIEGTDTWNMRYGGEFAWVRDENVPVWTLPSAPKPRRNITLQDGASVWVQVKQFYDRYDLDTVSALRGRPGGSRTGLRDVLRYGHYGGGGQDSCRSGSRAACDGRPGGSCGHDGSAALGKPRRARRRYLVHGRRLGRGRGGARRSRSDELSRRPSLAHGTDADAAGVA